MKPLANMKFLFLAVFIFFLLPAHTQDIAIGNWRTHFPVNSMVGVTQNQDEVFYAGKQMILILNKAEQSIDRLDKVAGLTQVGISVIKYYTDMELLLVAYNDGNIDIVDKDRNVVNISDIKRYSLISEKKINHIHFNENFAYLSYSFGLVKLDLDKQEVKSTFLTPGFGVNASLVIDETIFMSTDEGIYQGNPTVNLADFNNWMLHGTAQNVPSFYYSNAMVWFDDKMFADVNDTLKVYNGTTWEHFANRDAAQQEDKTFFHNENNNIRYLETSLDGSQLSLTTNFGLATIEKNGFYYLYGTKPNKINNPQQTIRDGDFIYFADISLGAFVLTGFDNFDRINVNAPFSKNASQITIANNQVWQTAGGVNASWQATNRFEGIFSFVEGEWDFYNKLTHDSLQDVNDLIPIAIHPSNGKVYGGSYNAGLVEINGDEVTIFGKEGTTLENPALDPFTVRVTGLAFDESANLWMSNYEAQRPISVFKADGTWESFPLPSASNQVAEMVIDNNGSKWMAIVRGSGGVAVFNENEPVVGTNDNRFRILTTGNSELPSNEVNCLAVDRDGDIWVGTLEGTVVFECSNQIFTTDGCRGRKVIVEEDEIGDHLLSTENVTTIAVDGADRKWFGTDNGIFVQSADGEKTIYRFTSENSPLPSDKIIDIAINDETGEVFIATEEGLISYRADATGGDDLHSDNVYAYPNPVRPDYAGPIAIKGLVENANVKITDISGALIFETTARGGQAIWDGRDYNGRKAATGVYLVFSANRDGLETFATKIVIVN